jgi:hypothetical protein
MGSRASALGEVVGGVSHLCPSLSLLYLGCSFQKESRQARVGLALPHTPTLSPALCQVLHSCSLPDFPTFMAYGTPTP